MISGGVVGAARFGAVGLKPPRRGAGDDPTDNGTHAFGVLIALAVAEVCAPCFSIAATAKRAAASGSVAVAAADPVGAAAAAVAWLVTIQVVAVRAAAVVRAAYAPPAAIQRARRAAVGSVDCATELGVAVAAEPVAVATRTAAVADLGVRRSGLGHEVDRSDSQRRADHCGLGQEAATGAAASQHRSGCGGETSAQLFRPPARENSATAVVGGAKASGNAVNAKRTRYEPNATRPSMGRPAAG